MTSEAVTHLNSGTRPRICTVPLFAQGGRAAVAFGAGHRVLDAGNVAGTATRDSDLSSGQRRPDSVPVHTRLDGGGAGAEDDPVWSGCGPTYKWRPRGGKGSFRQYNSDEAPGSEALSMRCSYCP